MRNLGNDTVGGCTLTDWLKNKSGANASRGPVGNGGVGTGANAIASVAVVSASEAPFPSISPTGLMPPEAQSVSYNECKFHSYLEGGCTHKKVLKLRVVGRSGERGALSPGGRGIQAVERKGVIGELLLGIPSCLSPYRQLLLTGVRPEGKSVRVCGGSLRIAHCGSST